MPGLDMTSNSSGDGRSPADSDNVGGSCQSWDQFWDNDIPSLSGLRLGADTRELTELTGLVEDKEIAARAVAFVINSTRKGIVPLCSDVASLLRQRKTLEKRVRQLQQENDRLRSSHRAVPVTCPACNHVVIPAASSRPCSRCSSGSCTTHGHGPLNGRGDSGRSSRSRGGAGGSRGSPVGLSSRRLDQESPPSPQKSSAFSSTAPSSTTGLPEMTAVPNRGLPKITPSPIGSTPPGVSGSDADSPSTDLQIKEALQVNASLAEDLGDAKREVQVLSGRVKELEMKQVARQYTERLQRDNSLPENDSSDNAAGEGSSGRAAKDQKSAPWLRPPMGERATTGAMAGCSCSMCANMITAGQHPKPTGTDNRRVIATGSEVRVGDRVVAAGEKTGRVRYIGHLDSFDQATLVFVGLELDAPVGRHDGCLNTKRYFTCEADRGVFVPLHDVLCLIDRPPRREDGADKPAQLRDLGDFPARPPRVSLSFTSGESSGGDDSSPRTQVSLLSSHKEEKREEKKKKKSKTAVAEVHRSKGDSKEGASISKTSSSSSATSHHHSSAKPAGAESVRRPRPPGSAASARSVASDSSDRIPIASPRSITGPMSEVDCQIHPSPRASRRNASSDNFGAVATITPETPAESTSNRKSKSRGEKSSRRPRSSRLHVSGGLGSASGGLNDLPPGLPFDHHHPDPLIHVLSDEPSDAEDLLEIPIECHSYSRPKASSRSKPQQGRSGGPVVPGRSSSGAPSGGRHKKSRPAASSGHRSKYDEGVLV